MPRRQPRVRVEAGFLPFSLLGIDVRIHSLRTWWVARPVREIVTLALFSYAAFPGCLCRDNYHSQDLLLSIVGSSVWALVPCRQERYTPGPMLARLSPQGRWRNVE